MRSRHAVAALLVLGLSLLCVVRPAGAQTSTTEPSEETVTIPETTLDGGPLLVPGEPEASASSSDADEANNDNTGTVVALVISGLLVVALLLALLTYWFWRNTRPGMPSRSAPATPASTTQPAQPVTQAVGGEDG